MFREYAVEKCHEIEKKNGTETGTNVKNNSLGI